MEQSWSKCEMCAFDPCSEASKIAAKIVKC